MSENSNDNVQKEKCPNCDVELLTAKFSDLETADGYCFDVWVTYCTKCRYIHKCDAN